MNPPNDANRSLRRNLSTVKRQRPVIAIDGPAGAGKSTLAAHLARRFGFLNLETGAMYRALALKAIENDFAFDEEAPLLDLADHTRITLEPQLEGNRVLLDGIDVSRRIREPDVTSAASQSLDPPQPPRLDGAAAARPRRSRAASSWKAATSAPPSFPTPRSRSSSTPHPRSAATAATARSLPRRVPADPAELRPPEPDPQTAEQQRAAEEAILRELKERDYRDRHRAESPLQPAADAVILDSTAMTLDEVLARAEQIVRSHLRAAT